MKFGVVVFPGSNCHEDCYHVVKDVLKQDCRYIWHTDTHIDHVDAVVLPGGFSYGDYLRCGAMAVMSPVMTSIYDFVDKGRLVIGICNGFQILLEAGLLPGSMLPNNNLEFRCQWVDLKVENNNTPFTSLYRAEEKISMPIAHYEGNYYASDDVLEELKAGQRIIFTYHGGNPNGSAHNIAGIINEKGNVLGLMPHPERCCEKILGGDQGLKVFASMLKRYMDKNRMGETSFV